VPLLGDAWRRSPDPEKSRDPQVQLVLSGLRRLSTTVAPDPTFRAELRAQLVAITPRVIAEGDVDAAPVLPSRAPRPTPRAVASGATLATAGADAPRIRSGFGAISIRRVAVATTLALVAMIVLLGTAVFLSRNALPGDTLYGLKRASENFQLATDNSSEKAHDLLRFASRRVDEAQDLAGRAQAAGSGPQAAGLSSQTQKYIQQVLASSDSDVRQASRILGDQAVDSANARPLTTLTSWAPTQLSKLHDLSSSLGSTSLGMHVARSAALITSAQARAAELSQNVGCGCLRSAPSDSLGPKPCTACAKPATPSQGGTGTQPTRPAPSPTSFPVHSGNGAGGASGTGTGTAHSSHGGAAAHTGSVPSSTPSPSPTKKGIVSVTLPTGKPTSTPPLVDLNSCGVGLNVGGIGIGLNLCPNP